MVRKVIVIACLSASLLIFIDTIDVVHSIIMFLLAGIIPGTNIALSPNQMMALMLILTAICVGVIASAPLRTRLSRLANSKHSSRGRLKRV